MQQARSILSLGLFFLPLLLTAQVPLVLVGYHDSGPIVNYQTTLSLLRLTPDGCFTYSVFDHWWGPSIHSIGEGELQDQAVVSTGRWRKLAETIVLDWQDSTPCLGQNRQLVWVADGYWQPHRAGASPDCELPGLQALEEFLIAHPWLQPWVDQLAQLSKASHRVGGI